ncbi:hypothetical protein V5O48_002240 [Marasmius crinis-equi]|uniref:Carrier domain-containing protein n=1 Tax=Marasmius crinis-equi TaxID=585013 RepID=A0ABR3FW51_9AGAR
MTVTVQRAPQSASFDCTPVRFPPSRPEDVKSSKENSFDGLTFDFPTRDDAGHFSKPLLVLAALFVVHYRSTGVEDAALGITDDSPGMSIVCVHVDPEMTLSRLVDDTIRAIEGSSSNRAHPKTPNLSVGVSTRTNGRSSKLSMEWRLAGQREVVYDSSVYSRSDIQNIWENMVDIIAAVSTRPDLSVGEVAFSNARKQLRCSKIRFQPPPSPSYTFTTVPEAFRYAAATNPDQLAVVDGETSLTYTELDFYSTMLTIEIAKALDGRTDTGFISWCIPPSPLAIVVILAIIKYGAAYVPLDIRLPSARLDSLIQDSGACLLITTSDSPEISLDEAEKIATLDVTGFLERTSNTAIPRRRTRPSANSLAYVMYTSGSTGKPKGVCIDHGAVLSLVYDRGRFQLGPGDRVAQINNLAWDGSVFDVWCTLLTGATLVSFNRYDILEPTILAKRFQELDVHCTFITTSLFRQILNIAPDLFRSLRTLLVGGESIDYDQYHKLGEVNPSIKLFNMYGPTETCCYTTSYIVPMNNLPAQGVVPIGIGLEHTQCLVVDNNNKLVPPGVIGELVIGGRGVGIGYLGRPKETAESFVELESEELDQPKSRFYRSGDLVRWLPNGELQFEGRRQAGQVKIRGQRLELTEVEAACVRTGLVNHTAVAYVKPTDGRDTYLTSYMVRKPLPATDGDQTELPSLRQILAALKTALPSYMIPRHIHFVDSLPLTNSGKLDRRAIQEIALEADKHGGDAPDHDEKYAAPQSDVERRICEIFGEILPESGKVGAISDFFDVGGHSLLAMKLKWRLQQELHDQLSMRDIFSGATPRELAARADELAKISPSTGIDLRAFPKVAEGEYRPLTLGEARFWYAAKVDGPDDPTFACPHWLHIEGTIDEDVLERSISMIVQRHEVFRTVFSEVDGVPKGKIVDFFGGMERIDVSPDLDKEALENLLRGHALRPFKFGEDVMFRPILFRIDEDEGILLFALHHMISDGYSRDIIFRELSEIYNALVRGQSSSLPPIPVQYTAFAQWHATKEFEEMLEPQTEYWVKQLEGGTPAEFPLDFPRPETQNPDREGGLVSCTVAPALTRRLEVLGKEVNVTLYILLLTAIRIAHYRLTGEQDACLASSIANRTRPEAESLCGYFVNNMAYRIRLNGQVTLAAVFEQVRQLYLDAVANQDVPFWPRIANKVHTGSNKPMYLIVMGYHHFSTTSLELGEHAVGRVWDLDMKAVRSDLQIFFNREGDEIVGDFHYRKDLFKQETVEGIVDLFHSVLHHLGQVVTGTSEMSLGSLLASL